MKQIQVLHSQNQDKKQKLCIQVTSRDCFCKSQDQMDKVHDKQSMAEQQEEEDIISYLPEDVMVHVLSFLDMKCAVRTSSLSHRWKHVWTALPHLNFNCSAFRSKSIFSEFVNDTLTHRNNDIKLSGIELTFTGAATASSVVRKSVNYAYLHNVTKLSVKWVTKKFIQFPQELFSSHTLKHFTLATNVQCFLLCKTSCVPKLAWDFPVLETLILKNIRLGDEGDESLDLFSKCVNLKDLTLHQCCMKELNILNIYASQLSHIKITQSLSLPNVFNVIAPQLKYVTASVKATTDRFPVSFDSLRLSTEGFDHIEEVNLSLSKPHYNRERFVPVLLDLFQTLRSAKILSIDTAIIEVNK